MNTIDHPETNVSVDGQNDSDRPITQHHCQLTKDNNQWQMHAMSAGDMSYIKKEVITEWHIMPEFLSKR